MRGQFGTSLVRRQLVQREFVLGLFDRQHSLIGREPQLFDLKLRDRHHGLLAVALRLGRRLFIGLDVLLIFDLGQVTGLLIEPNIDIVGRLLLGHGQIRTSYFIGDQHHLLPGLDRIPFVKFNRPQHPRPIAGQGHLSNQHDPTLGHPHALRCRRRGRFFGGGGHRSHDDEREWQQ